MNQFSLPDFIDAHLTRYIRTIDEPDVTQRVNRVLKMNHPHIDTDQERLIRGATLILKGVSATPLSVWAAKASKYAAALDILDAPNLPEEARLTLVGALGNERPTKDMRAVRMTTSMLAIVREDAKSTLVAPIKTENPDALDFHTCGEVPYATYLLDLLASPPQGVFCLIEFDKTPPTVGTIFPAFNSGSANAQITIRNHESQYRTHLFREALAATRNSEPTAPIKLIGLINTRRANPEASAKTDKKIEAMQADFPSAPDFYDLADLLTELTSAELRLLRFSLFRDKNGTDETQNNTSEDDI